ncbi:nucleotidyltransferase [bacterium]|nr:MAG: nucleotidyltransferase [bacterium]
MKTLSEIKQLLTLNKQVLFNKYKIKTLAIFGSYARNEANENSDIDILVDFNDIVGIEFIDLAKELENLIGFRVDLVSRKGIKPKYFDYIKEELIYV